MGRPAKQDPGQDLRGGVLGRCYADEHARSFFALAALDRRCRDERPPGLGAKWQDYRDDLLMLSQQRWTSACGEALTSQRTHAAFAHRGTHDAIVTGEVHDQAGDPNGPGPNKRSGWPDEHRCKLVKE
jgi:hypothetical protein